GQERDVVLAQVLADQSSGVAGSSVDDHALVSGHGSLLSGGCSGHMPMPPSTGRPAPVMNLAASEARKTTASAMSSTCPRRPCGVRSTTACAAASADGKRPASAQSAASWLPIVVGVSPG